jgi:hypothetical protein
VPATAPPGPLPNVSGRSIQQAVLFHHYHEPTGFIHHPRRVPAPAYLPPDAPGLTPETYPYLNAPLYPVPRPDIPWQTGGAVITNQAFYPHEMLYPHTYKAMFPPYYYDVHGCWKTLPWGVSQSECWRLRGTVVKVRYNSCFKICSGFVPPALP